MLAGCVRPPEEVADRYRREGFWRGETLGGMLRASARRYGERIAIVDGVRRISYRELDQRVDRLATGLAGLGIGAGDRVVVQLPNVAEFVDTYFALFRIGAVPVVALPAHRSAEVGSFLRQTDAVAYVIPARLGGFDYRRLAADLRVGAPNLRHVLVVDPPAASVNEVDATPDDFGCVSLASRYVDLAEAERFAIELERTSPAPDDVALLQVSGGSTDIPKLIPRTHDDYLYTARACAVRTGFDPDGPPTADGDVVYLGALPIGHNFPLVSPGLVGVLELGGRTVMAAVPAPEVTFALIEAERVTMTSLVPPLALVWLDAAATTRHDLSSLRILQVGGAKCGPELAARVRSGLGCVLQQVFGMAEGLINATRLDDPDDVLVNTQGRPVSPADEVRVVDDDDRDVPDGVAGHLLTRGPYTIRGYYRAEAQNAEAFTADGFYRTGDIVVRRPDGNLVVTGRGSEQINRGGEKVAPTEVENHLLAHPAVFDAAVVAMPDQFLGERGCAYVVPRGERPKAADLLAFLRGRGLAAYKIPDRIEFVPEFPRIGVGKTSKRELRAALTAGLAAETEPAKQ